MRIPLLTILAAGIFLAANTSGQESSTPADGGHPLKETPKSETPVPAPESKEPSGQNSPPLPPETSQNLPLPPLPEDKLGEGGLPPPPPGFTETSIGDAGGPGATPMNLLDLHGYLRLRGDLIDGGDLGLRSRSPYPQFPNSASGGTDTLAGANLRFRLEPTINISEDVRIMGQIDLLDNLVLGSTPDGFPSNGYYPLDALSDNQISPRAGGNSLNDSVQVKRIWGEVMTPAGLLRFGRMGAEWGLGLLENDGGSFHFDRGPLVTQRDPFATTGQCFDCDYGSTVDRIMFITKIGGHYVVPMIDFTAEGPFSSHPNETAGQPVDLDQLDDVNSFILAVTRRDKPEDIRRALEQDDWVLNYGLFFMFRNQPKDAIDYHLGGKASDGASQQASNFVVRDAELYVPDIWARFLWRKLRLELEAVMVIGNLRAPDLDADGQILPGVPDQKLSLLQFGGVLQGDYAFLNDQLIFGLEVGFASGDDSKGFGVRPFQERQYGLEQNGNRDKTLNNFRFSPDYHVDLLLWRQIIGTVTDALYVKPSLQYNISEGFGTKLSGIYSSAIYASSPRGQSQPLGLEFDLDVFYFSQDNFHAGFSYGILIPFSGMNDLGNDEKLGGIADVDKDKDAAVAHRFMGRLVLYF